MFRPILVLAVCRFGAQLTHPLTLIRHPKPNFGSSSVASPFLCSIPVNLGGISNFLPASSITTPISSPVQPGSSRYTLGTQNLYPRFTR